MARANKRSEEIAALKAELAKSQAETKEVRDEAAADAAKLLQLRADIAATESAKLLAQSGIGPAVGWATGMPVTASDKTRVAQKDGLTGRLTGTPLTSVEASPRSPTPTGAPVATQQRSPPASGRAAAAADAGEGAAVDVAALQSSLQEEKQRSASLQAGPTALVGCLCQACCLGSVPPCGTAVFLARTRSHSHSADLLALHPLTGAAEGGHRSTGAAEGGEHATADPERRADPRWRLRRVHGAVPHLSRPAVTLQGIVDVSWQIWRADGLNMTCMKP